MSVTVRGILRRAIRVVNAEIRAGTFTEGLPVILRLKKQHIDVLLDKDEKNAMGKMLESLEKDIKKHLGIKDPEKVERIAKRKVSTPTIKKPEKEVSTVKCVFVGMVDDCCEADKKDIEKHGLKERNRSQFAKSIDSIHMITAGIKVTKSSLVSDKDVGMYYCIIRGIFHQILIIKDQKYLFVSEKYKY